MERNDNELTTPRLSDRTLTFVILLYLCLIYLPLIIARSDSTESFIRGDSYYYRAFIESILKDGDLLLANNIAADPLDGQLALGREGLVPKHPILLSLVSLPFYLLFGTPGLLLFNIFDCMILMVLIFRLNCLFYHHLLAFIVTILYATGTLFFDYAYSYSPDIFSTVLLLAGFYLVLRSRFYVGAALLSLSIFAKAPNALLAGVILVYAVFMIQKGETGNGSLQGSFRNKLSVTIAMAAVFVLALVPFAYTNYMLFGSPIVTGYQRAAVAGAQGEAVVLANAVKFDQPLLKGIYLSLFTPRNGILPTNPVLILACLGAFWVRRIEPRDKAYLILLLCLMQFILFAKYDQWYTSDFSNRFLMTFIALSSVFTSNSLSYFGTKLSLDL